MHITIINDCRDANASGRQVARAAVLTLGQVSFIGVASDLEAAGNLVDALDAYGGAPGAVLVNVAPRSGSARKWGNGTPFGYFWYRKILVVGTVDGRTLSLVKKLRLAERVGVLDIPSVVRRLVSQKLLSSPEGTAVAESQFRSYDFLPRAAAYLLKNREIVGEELALQDIATLPASVWWIDNFGNCKTTLLPSDIPQGSEIKTKFGWLPYYGRFRDAPDGVTAVIVGSSGIGGKRFLEIIRQGGSAAETLGVSSGARVF